MSRRPCMDCGWFYDRSGHTQTIQKVGGSRIFTRTKGSLTTLQPGGLFRGFVLRKLIEDVYGGIPEAERVVTLT